MVSARRQLRGKEHLSVFVTVKPVREQVLLSVYDMENADWLPRMAELQLSAWMNWLLLEQDLTGVIFESKR